MNTPKPHKITMWALSYMSLTSNDVLRQRRFVKADSDISGQQTIDGVALFETRVQARKAQQRRYTRTRVEKVVVTIMAVEGD